MSIEQYKSKGGFRRLFKALIYSIKGLKATYQNEAAFRQELALAIVLLPLGLVLGQSYLDKILLSASVILVLIFELINSAIESLADAISTEHNPLLGRAKDQASAAVLIAIMLMILIWLLILIKQFI